MEIAQVLPRYLRCALLVVSALLSATSATPAQILPISARTAEAVFNPSGANTSGASLTREDSLDRAVPPANCHPAPDLVNLPGAIPDEKVFGPGFWISSAIYLSGYGFDFAVSDAVVEPPFTRESNPLVRGPNGEFRRGRYIGIYGGAYVGSVLLHKYCRRCRPIINALRGVFGGSAWVAGGLNQRYLDDVRRYRQAQLRHLPVY